MYPRRNKVDAAASTAAAGAAEVTDATVVNNAALKFKIPAKTTGKRYNALQLRAMYRLADLDGSGNIDFNEFIHAQRRMKKNWGTAKAATFLSMAMGKIQDSKPNAP